ncbi:hypothetical protein CCR94_12205 [Rhodoblastus sphagnicola]|uniref:Glycosyltransferase 61 catalytic domain-containing protein n=1 Tax=Rhodoblastus sphagnicola TaxID=333368 RepID=A0A2S6N7J6_9HYPH|nr:glycosyltransferase family 61 protein [Rhodoblastus sphagnicola]MBB4196245.1 hypothetical protein [Rhodoblastus sphagnicola]PPQ30567.1 hypothetical protein CCR94_12205 [Rhodoblastus sphagnicola]
MFRKRPSPRVTDAFSSVHRLVEMDEFDVEVDPGRHVVPAYPGQSSALLTACFAQGRLPNRLTLKLGMVEDGYLWIGPRQDGVLIDRTGALLDKFRMFRHDRTPVPSPEELRRSAIPLDRDVFTSVDCAWGNYYHWLCFGVARALLARRIAGFDADIVVPDYRESTKRWRMGMSRRTWEQTLDLSGMSDRILRLKPGIYSFRRGYGLFLDQAEDTLVTCLPAFDRAFEPLRARLRVNPASPRRLLIARRDKQRLGDAEAGRVMAQAESRGFTPVYPEDHDFLQQAELFHNADAVIAAHGAALTNLLFGRRSLKVLEINRHLSNEPHLRPWMYFLARNRGQDYRFLNASEGDLETDRLKAAIDSLCEPGSSPEPWFHLDPRGAD